MINSHHNFLFFIGMNGTQQWSASAAVHPLLDLTSCELYVACGHLVSLNDSCHLPLIIRCYYPKGCCCWLHAFGLFLPFLQKCSEWKLWVIYNENKWENKPSCRLLYTDGVFSALFTPVSNQIGAVSSVQELHLSLVSLHRPCKPEPPREQLLHLDCSKSLWTWGWE